MARNPFPSFNWYPGDWLASRARALMTFEQQAAYRNLLDHAWVSDPPCSLPDDDEQLALLSGLGRRWGRAAPNIRPWFFVRDGRLWNRKLLEVFRRAKDFREEKSRAGKAGNAKRWKDKAKDVSHSDRSATFCESQTDRKTSLPTPTPTPTPNIPYGQPRSVDGSSEKKNGGTTNADIVKELFDLGVRVLTNQGVEEKQARSVIGKVKKVHGDAEAMRLLIESEKKTSALTYLLKTCEEKPYYPC